MSGPWSSRSGRTPLLRERAFRPRIDDAGESWRFRGPLQRGTEQLHFHDRAQHDSALYVEGRRIERFDEYDRQRWAEVESSWL